MDAAVEETTRRAALDRELCIDPSFFEDLVDASPSMASVRTCLRRGPHLHRSLLSLLSLLSSVSSLSSAVNCHMGGARSCTCPLYISSEHEPGLHHGKGHRYNHAYCRHFIDHRLHDLRYASSTSPPPRERQVRRRP